MSRRASLLTTLLVCGCNSDGLLVPLDGGADDRAPHPDIAMPPLADLATPELATVPLTWIREFGTADDDVALAVATDAPGNAYVTGWTKGGLDGNPNAGGNDAFLVKFDRSGNKLWTRQFGSPRDDVGWDVATDGMGNVVVLGWYAFVAKFDSDGNKLWQLETTAQGVATDNAGNVFVAGVTGDALDGNQYAGRGDVFLVKYDGTGNKLWTRELGSPESDNAAGVATDAAGNAYVTGTTLGRVDGKWKGDWWDQDAFLAKYDANGAKLWTRQFGSDGADYANGVAIDRMGNAYVAGATSGGVDGNRSAGSWDAFVAKYDASGNKLWTRQFGTPWDESARRVATDGAGSAFVAGTSETALDGNRNGHGGLFLVKYDANGNELWTRQPVLGLGTAVAVGSGGIYVTGYTTVALDGNQYAGGKDAFVARYPAEP